MNNISSQTFIYDQPFGYIGNGWKAPRGKLLTNRRIRDYQKEGYYRHMGPGYVIPPTEGEPCLGCKTTKNTRKCPFDYLPAKGYWCSACRTQHREQHLKDKEESRRMKELMLSEFDGMK